MLGAISTIIGTGINAVQRGQEKDRQERLDAYNQELNRKNQVRNDVQNSPGYQYQRMKDLGFNPMAQGGFNPEYTAPNAGTSTLTPQPMETSSVGSTLVNGMNAAVSNALTQSELDIKEKNANTQLYQAKIQEANLEYQRKKSEAEMIVAFWNDGKVEHSDGNKKYYSDRLKDLGFDVEFEKDGLINLKEGAALSELNSRIELLEEQSRKTSYEASQLQPYAENAYEQYAIKYKTDLANYNNALADYRIKYQDRRYKELLNSQKELENVVQELETNAAVSGLSDSPAYIKAANNYLSNVFKNNTNKNFANAYWKDQYDRGNITLEQFGDWQKISAAQKVGGKISQEISGGASTLELLKDLFTNKASSYETLEDRTVNPYGSKGSGGKFGRSSRDKKPTQRFVPIQPAS